VASGGSLRRIAVLFVAREGGDGHKKRDAEEERKKNKERKQNFFSKEEMRDKPRRLLQRTVKHA
jgi:hypothetical protein